MSSSQDTAERRFRIVGAAILLLALVLRVIGARGDLAQDEITTLKLLAPIQRIDKIFWDINNDNNHPLNSAWLYLVGPRASYLAMRAFSIVLGVATVWVAGLWGARRSRATALVAMLLFATSYLMVGFGSEARGYSGFILCIVLAVMQLESMLNGTDRRLAFGVCALLGYLFHFDMCLALVAFAVCCLWIVWRRTNSFARAFDQTLRIFLWPAGFLAIAFSPLILHRFSLGSVIPFHLTWFLKAYDIALQCAANLPGLVLDYSDVVLAVPLAAFWFVRHKWEMRASFYAAAIIVLPLLISLLHVPNTNYPRHAITGAVAFTLMLAEIATWAGSKAGPMRLAAMAAVLAILAGNGMLLAKFFANQRGHYGEAVARLTANGPTTYGMSSPQLAGMVSFYAIRQDKPAPAFVATDDWCTAGAPAWFIVDTIAQKPPAESEATFGPATCQAHYHLEQVYPYWGLSGVSWNLFKRNGGEP